jgi:hypothetical protein
LRIFEGRNFTYRLFIVNKDSMKIGIAKFISTLLLCVVVLGISRSTASAQARPSSKGSVISLDVLELALRGPLAIQYEWKTTPVNSWALRGYFWPARDYYSAFGVGAAYRFYVADSRALTGLSVAPAGDVYFFSSSELDKSATIFLVGGDLAYKWIFDAFAVEPMFGIRIGFGGSESVSYATGFLPVLSVNLGYAW